MPDLQSLMNLLLPQFIALFAGHRDLLSESGVGLSSSLRASAVSHANTPLGARGGSCFQETVARFGWRLSAGTPCVSSSLDLPGPLSEVSSVDVLPCDEMCFAELLRG